MSGNGGSQAPPPTQLPLHPEIRSVVQLTVAHANKIYFSGPLVRRFERQPDGKKPLKDEGWAEVWAQLGGTTLSVWVMKEIQEASAQGREVPPSYINVTDAFVQVLGAVTVPATPTTPSIRYANVLTLNTAGCNLLLFSCPSTSALISWAAALRLAAWEKSRLEEIYTAHLIRITFPTRDIPTTLVRGKLESWAKIRIAGQTDWKRVWLVVQEGAGIEGDGAGPAGPAVNVTLKKKRMSSIFSRATNAPNPPSKPLISIFRSPKPKDRIQALMTIHDVGQAFGVYPERPELINRSTLLKVVGTFGDDDMAAALRTREGWILIMPEVHEETKGGQAVEMLKWIIGLHEAFKLYGRPEAWIWDPRDPVSMMFGYPVGPHKDNLFLDRELVESMDPRDDRTLSIRSTMKDILQTLLKPAVEIVQPPSPPRNVTESQPVPPPIAATSETDAVRPDLQDGLASPTESDEPSLQPVFVNSAPTLNGSPPLITQHPVESQPVLPPIAATSETGAAQPELQDGLASATESDEPSLPPLLLNSAPHSALQNPAILRNILGNFRPYFYLRATGQLLEEHVEVEGEYLPTLRSAALTCRLFLEPSLDNLWWASNDLTPLFCILSGFHKSDVPGHIRGPISESDCILFDKYARKIKLYSVAALENICPSAYGWMLQIFNRDHILPCLQYLFTDTPSNPVLRFLTSPSLRSFAFY